MPTSSTRRRPRATRYGTRLAGLMAEVEVRTHAVVVGVAGERSQLATWRFDREIAPPLPLAA